MQTTSLKFFKCSLQERVDFRWQSECIGASETPGYAVSLHVRQCICFGQKTACESHCFHAVWKLADLRWQRSPQPSYHNIYELMKDLFPEKLARKFQDRRLYLTLIYKTQSIQITDLNPKDKTNKSFPSKEENIL